MARKKTHRRQPHSRHSQRQETASVAEQKPLPSEKPSPVDGDETVTGAAETEIQEPKEQPSSTAIKDANGVARAKKETAVTTPELVAAGPRKSKLAEKQKKAEPEADWEKTFRKIANTLGSLKLAVVLLSIFALVVFLGTLMEHWYTTKIAQELVYQSWWFNLLLFLLMTTIFFAAVKKMQFNREPLKLPPITATSLPDKTRAYANRIWLWMSHYWPWKRHQFGFIVTHIGLITMLIGGLLNGLYGTDAFVQLISTDDPNTMSLVQRRLGYVPHSADYCVYSDVDEISVEAQEVDPHGGMFGKHHHFMGQKPDSKPKVYRRDFWGGVFPWHRVEGSEPPKTDALLSVMNFLHNPLSKSWVMYMDNDAKLEVINFAPLTRREEYSKGTHNEYPAFKLQLRSEKFPEPIDTWVSSDPQDPNRSFGGGPILVESIGHCPTELLGEFLNPPFADVPAFNASVTGMLGSPAAFAALPAAATLVPGRSEAFGKKGYFTIHLSGKTYRFSVTQDLEGKIEVGDTGYHIRINEFLDDPDELADKHEQTLLTVGGPAVDIDLWDGDDNRTSLLIFARLAGAVYDRDNEEIFDERSGGVSFFYHSPEVNQGSDMTRGVLQFIHGTDGQLYYRSFVVRDGHYVLEKSGAADLKEKTEYPIWGKMGWYFRILEHFDHAYAKSRLIPLNVAPGKESKKEAEKYPPGVKCRLTVGSEEYEFWMQKGQIMRGIQLGDTRFTVRYSYKEKPLGFKIKLNRAEQTVDPGTNAPASYTSWVQIYDKDKGVQGKHEVITMNEPLDYNGYTFYQSNYEFTGLFDSSGKPVSISGFTVGRDPGLSLKYAGSIMLGLGIAIMFYMKAYFFKPRKRIPAPNA